MKKILLLAFFITSAIANAIEIFDEFYVMEKVIPFLQKSSTRVLNEQEIKVIRVNKEILEALDTTSSPFYFHDSNHKKAKAKLGDYIFSPLNLAEVYVIHKEDLK